MKTTKATVLAVLVALFVSAPLFAEVIDATGNPGTVKEIEVTSTGMRFNQTEIRVNLGDTVRLTYKNGGGRHDWALAEFNAATAVITGGQSSTVEFVVDKAGTFEFYCGVPGHRAAGMVGRFVVVE